MTKEKIKNPPKLAEWILSCVYPDRGDFTTVGDFREEYLEVYQSSGPFKANLWYWMQIAKSFPNFIRNKSHWSAVMIHNYLKIALRNIKKHKGYSIINITGLALGMACSLMIILFVHDELSYDKFHDNIDSLYRIHAVLYNPDGSELPYKGQLPMIMGEVLSEHFPEIQSYTRIRTSRGVVRYKDRIFQEQFQVADAPFFEMFSFPLIAGNPATALAQDDSIVLTESYAQKYFGTESPLGKTLTVTFGQNQKKYRVTGVARDIPRNSTLQFNLLINSSNLPFSTGYPDVLTSWNTFSTFFYIRLRDNAAVESVKQRFPAFWNQYFSSYAELMRERKYWIGSGNPFSLGIQRMSDVYLDPNSSPGTGLKTSFILSGIAFIILLVACINFMNLSVSVSSLRSKEVGIRKVCGAEKKNLLFQFWGESFVLCTIAMFVGIFLALLFLPVFNELSGKQLNPGSFKNLKIILALVFMTIMTGIFSGTYPALIMSSFNPVHLFSGRMKLSRKKHFTKCLVIFQFALAVALIISSLFLVKQLSYMMNKNIGYDTQGLISISIQENTKQVRDRVVSLFRSRIVQHSSVHGVAISSQTFGMGIDNTRIIKKGTAIRSNHIRVDYDYFKTQGLQIVEGRNFSNEISSDTEAVVINQRAVEELGLESPLGQFLGDPSQGYPNNLRIIGVVKDFNFRSLHHEIYPVIFHMLPSWPYDHILVRISSLGVKNTLDFLEDSWKAVQPDKPFIYYFQEEVLKERYNSEKKWSMILTYSSLLAILIACMGILGLTSIAVSRRTKEIGIRKILGARFMHITNLVFKDFIWLVLAGNLVAWPIVYMIMRSVLQNYPYRISIDIHYFLLAGMLSVLVATGTVLFITVKAATANPVDSLRYE